MKGRGEDAVAAWLQQRLEPAMHDATISLRLHPQRAEAGNPCPDFVIELEVLLPLLPGRPLTVRVPLLVEVEGAAGVDEALLDLERYVDRANDGSQRQPPAIELPFVAVTAHGGGHGQRLLRRLPVRFVVTDVALTGDDVSET